MNVLCNLVHNQYITFDVMRRLCSCFLDYVQIMIHDFVLCIYHATAWWFLIELWFHYVIALSFPIQNVTGYEIAC